MTLKELKSFKRVHILKGEEKTIHFKIPVSELQKWDLKQSKWILYAGDYTISVGSNSQDLKINSNITVKQGAK
jgi:beta-glucosidase